MEDRFEQSFSHVLSTHIKGVENNYNISVIWHFPNSYKVSHSYFREAHSYEIKDKGYLFSYLYIYDGLQEGIEINY